MEYDIIFILGERYMDHPLIGVAILKRILEKNGYTVGIIDVPKGEKDILRLGKPKLFFGITSGSIDSMVRNYTPLKKERAKDIRIKYKREVPDRAVIIYSNWVRKYFNDSLIVLGGVESSLRRFTHYDYWQNILRKSIIFDSRANILVYGYGEKQCVEIARRIKSKENLEGIEGTCIRSREVPKDFLVIPSHEEVCSSKEKFCDMQNMLDNTKNLAQKTENFYILQYKFPIYTSKDLDMYYELPFSRNISTNYMKGFEFSIVSHRGCIGDCNFCSIKIMSTGRVVSRSEESILREIKYITNLPNFKGNIDDLGGPSANMYGMDCNKCNLGCIDCKNLDRTNSKLIHLLKEIKKIKEVKKLYIRSGIRYDLASDDYLIELKPHISGKLKIAPEHVSENVLALMNKNKGDLNKFLERFKKLNGGQLSFYFMVSHPGCTLRNAKELAERIKTLKNAESVQIFTPTPMTVSTCMYYTGLDPQTKKGLFVPRTYKEKKDQKRMLNLNKKEQEED